MKISNLKDAVGTDLLIDKLFAKYPDEVFTAPEIKARIEKEFKVETGLSSVGHFLKSRPCLELNKKRKLFGNPKALIKAKKEMQKMFR